eukprot:6623264-Prymnesium_polylepis.1
MLTALSLAPLAGNVETPWIEPTLCRTSDARFNRYVAYQPNASTGSPAVGTASKVVGDCDAALDVHSSVERVNFEADAAWPNGGANISVQ